MQPRISRFGFLTVSTRAQRDDNLKGVLARSKRKSKLPVTLPPIGEKHGGPDKAKTKTVPSRTGRR
jgi:hypothetical protein